MNLASSLFFPSSVSLFLLIFSLFFLPSFFSLSFLPNSFSFSSFSPSLLSGLPLPPLSLPLSLLSNLQVMIHPVTHSSHSLLAHVKRREQDASGYPYMSPVGVTLVHAIVEIVYQLQDKEPWSKAISQVLYMRQSLPCRNDLPLTSN